MPARHPQNPPVHPLARLRAELLPDPIQREHRIAATRRATKLSSRRSSPSSSPNSVERAAREWLRANSAARTPRSSPLGRSRARRASRRPIQGPPMPALVSRVRRSPGKSDADHSSSRPVDAAYRRSGGLRQSERDQRHLRAPLLACGWREGDSRNHWTAGCWKDGALGPPDWERPFKEHYQPPGQSRGLERATRHVKRLRLLMRTVPGQGPYRISSLEDLFYAKKPVAGVVHQTERMHFLHFGRALRGNN